MRDRQLPTSAYRRLRWAEISGRVELTPDEVDRLKQLMQFEPWTRYEREAKPKQRPGGAWKDYISDWNKCVGINPKMLYARLDLSGHGDLLPDISDFGKMLRAQKEFPLPLLRATLQQLGTSVEWFLGTGPARPFYADDLINKIDALIWTPRFDDGLCAETDRTVAAIVRLLDILVTQAASELLRDEQVAVKELRALEVYLERALDAWDTIFAEANRHAPDAPTSRDHLS